MNYTATIKEEVETKITVSLPRFTRKGDTFYAILGEDEMISVYLNDKRASIDTFVFKLDERATYMQITQKEFEDVFVKANELVVDKFETMRDKIEEKKNEIFDNPQKEAA